MEIHMDKGGHNEKKFKFRNIIIILILIILLFPLPVRLKDGGSIRYQSILYSITKVHRLNTLETENMYLKGYEVKILNMKVYNNMK